MQARIALKKQPTQVGFDSLFSPRSFFILSFYYFLVLFSYCKSQAQPQEHDVSSIAVSLKKKFFGFEGFFLFPYGVQLYVSFYVETFTQMRAKRYVRYLVFCKPLRNLDVIFMKINTQLRTRLKVNQSRYIALNVVRGSIEKLSQLFVSLSTFFSIFWFFSNRFLHGGKMWGYDSLLISWFVNIKWENFLTNR